MLLKRLGIKLSGIKASKVGKEKVYSEDHRVKTVINFGSFINFLSNTPFCNGLKLRPLQKSSRLSKILTF